MGQIAGSILSFVSPETIGMPLNIVRKLTHLGASGGTNGTAIILSACEINLEGLDLEDWNGPILDCGGGSPVAMRSLHVERYGAIGGKVFNFANNGSFVLEDMNISGNVDASAGMIMFSFPGTNSQVTIDRVQFELIITTPANFTVLSSDSSNNVTHDHLLNVGTSVTMP